MGKQTMHNNAFLESGCRCEICDRFGTKNIPVRGLFVCDACKEKKETKVLLERRRISGLVALALHRTKESYDRYLKDSTNLLDLLNQQKEIEGDVKK